MGNGQLPFVNQRFVVVARDAIDLNVDDPDEGVAFEVDYAGAATIMLELADALLDSETCSAVRGWCERKCPSAVDAVYPAQDGE